MGPYDLGAPVPTGDLEFTLKDDAGNPVDALPSPPVLTITLPDATTQTPAVKHTGLGTYTPQSPFVTTLAGHHLWNWTAAGTYPGAFMDSFEVWPGSDPTITSLAEERDILKIPDDDHSRDMVIRGYSQAITEWIEYVCGPVVTRQFTENIRAQGELIILSKAPIRTDLGTTFDASPRRDGATTNGIVSITPLLSYGFMYDLNYLLVDGPSGMVRHLAGLPFLYSGDPYFQYQAVYWAGRKVIPWGIYEGHKIALKHLYSVERGGLAQAASFGEEEVVNTGFGFAVPSRAAELINAHSGKGARAAIA